MRRASQLSSLSLSVFTCNGRPLPLTCGVGGVSSPGLAHSRPTINQMNSCSWPF